MINRIVNSGGTNELADDNTFCAIDHECTCLRHQRQVTHENLVFIDFICLFIIKTYFYLQGSCECRISFLAFFDGVLEIILTGAEREVYKIQTQMSAVIGDGRDVIEHFSKTFPKEPIIGILLDLNEVRHLQDFFLPGIAHSEVLTGCDRTYSVLFH